MYLRIAAATAALVLATSTLAFAARPAKFTLHPQNPTGETADVTTTQDGDNIDVAVTTQNGPNNPQPIHIHNGTCDTLDPKPLIPLKAVQAGTSTTTITPAMLKGVTLAQLQDGARAINIHHSATDGGTYYACGNIPKAK